MPQGLWKAGEVSWKSDAPGPGLWCDKRVFSFAGRGRECRGVARQTGCLAPGGCSVDGLAVALWNNDVAGKLGSVAFDGGLRRHVPGRDGFLVG